nr:ABC transporter permease [Kineosporia babensis]
MAAGGAERRDLRVVVLATNGLIGVLSSLVAAGLGAGLGALLIQVLRYLDYSMVRIDIHLTDLLVLVAVGGLTAVGASLVPARQAAKLDVVAALTGRRGYHPPKLRVPVAGLFLALTGAVFATLGAVQRLPFLAVLGIGVVEVGMVMASGAIVALAARMAVGLPFSARFALRDAARQRSRTAPAVAAVLAAVAGGSAALVYVAALTDHEERSYRASAGDSVVLLNSSSTGDDGRMVSSMTRARAIVEQELQVGEFQEYQIPATHGPNGTDFEIMPLMPPGAECPESQFAEAEVTEIIEGSEIAGPGPCGRRAAAETIEFSSGRLFDDGTALSVITAGQAPSDAAALKAGNAVTSNPELLWPDGTVRVRVERYDDAGDVTGSKVIPLKAVLAEPGQHSLYGVVYPLGAAEELGISLESGGFAAIAREIPSQAQEDRVNRQLDEEAGAYLSVERGYVDDYQIYLLVLGAVVAVVGLVGTFTAVGLAAAESRADVATLAAVGAGPGVRRRMAAAQAGVISGLGAVLGVLSGVLAGWVLVRLEEGDWAYGSAFAEAESWRFVLPWPQLLLIALGLPALAMTIGFLTTRSRLPLIRRLGQ